jgi:hypothetical protein
MSMINKTFAAVTLAAIAATLLLTATVSAEEPPPQSSDARYSFHKVADGYVRLDTQTGAVALCNRQPVGWACVTAPEDRVVLEHEIERLRAENAALKQALLAHGLPLPHGATAEQPAAGDDNTVTLRLPSNADVDRVIAFIGRVWHDFIEAIDNAQNQAPHKS